MIVLAENQLFQFFVRAQDSGKPQLHTDVPVDVYVMSPSEVPPVFEKKDHDYFLSESSPPGTLVSRVKLVGQAAGGPAQLIGNDSEAAGDSVPTTRFRVVSSLRDKNEESMFTVTIAAE